MSGGKKGIEMQEISLKFVCITGNTWWKQTLLNAVQFSGV